MQTKTTLNSNLGRSEWPQGNPIHQTKINAAAKDAAKE